MRSERRKNRCRTFSPTSFIRSGVINKEEGAPGVLALIRTRIRKTLNKLNVHMQTKLFFPVRDAVVRNLTLQRIHQCMDRSPWRVSVEQQFLDLEEKLGKTEAQI